jgi:hypothetical protein
MILFSSYSVIHLDLFIGFVIICSFFIFGLTDYFHFHVRDPFFVDGLDTVSCKDLFSVESGFEYELFGL